MTARIIIALIVTINWACTIYFWLIFARCLLSWFPVDRNKQPVAFLCYLTDGYLNLFRKIIPPFGGIDFSPIVATFALIAINIILVRTIAFLGAFIL